MSANVCEGYEIYFSCIHGQNYGHIARWDGAYNDWHNIADWTGHVHDGDVIMARVDGSTIKGYVNDIEVLSVVDATFSGGHPGIGFYVNGYTLSDVAFTEYTAWGKGYSASISLSESTSISLSPSTPSQSLSASPSTPSQSISLSISQSPSTPSR